MFKKNMPNAADPAEMIQPSTTKGSKTRIVVKYDAGFPNLLTIRGKGGGLNWNKGMPLKNVKPDEWVYELDGNLGTGEFKILINDKIYEVGPNHNFQAGATIQVNPKF